MAARYIFISYSRKDRSRVQELTATLRQLGHQVWLDESLAGGARWWAEILQQIEQCNVFLYVLSQHSLDSDACLAEKNYAQELGKPVLPVKVDTVPGSKVPSDLAQLQTINYIEPTNEGLIRLVNAMDSLPDPGPLPSPPPDKPPVPVSYLSQLGRDAKTAAARDEQILVIHKLGLIVESDEDPDKRAEALAIIDDMSRRHDLFADVEHQIRTVKSRAQEQHSVVTPPPPPPLVPGKPPGDTSLASKVKAGSRPAWLLPVIVGGAVILVALIVLCCVWANQPDDTARSKGPDATVLQFKRSNDLGEVP